MKMWRKDLLKKVSVNIDKVHLTPNFFVYGEKIAIICYFLDFLRILKILKIRVTLGHRRVCSRLGSSLVCDVRWGSDFRTETMKEQREKENFVWNMPDRCVAAN